MSEGLEIAMAKSIYRVGGVGDRPLSEPGPGATPIMQALRYGITAPSAHNTQPWRIVVTSDTGAKLFFDAGRRLPETDPPGRQVHISHGTLIEMTSIAATSLGYRTEVDILPEGEMTVAEFGTRPTAILRLSPEPGLKVDPLFEAILGRRSSRLPHEGPPLTADERCRIEREANRPEVSVGWVGEDRHSKTLDIVARAMAVEAKDHVLFDETRTWFRFSDWEIAEKGDGLDLDTAGLSGMALRLARVFTTRAAWNRWYNVGPFFKAFARATSTTRALLTLTTPTNTMHDWILTGRSYVRAQLAAGHMGLRFHPVSQALQEFPRMEQLRVEMERLLNIEPPAKLQMIVRVGRTAQPGLSPRRNLSSMLET